MSVQINAHGTYNGPARLLWMAAEFLSRYPLCWTGDAAVRADHVLGHTCVPCRHFQKGPRDEATKTAVDLPQNLSSNAVYSVSIESIIDSYVQREKFLPNSGARM